MRNRSIAFWISALIHLMVFGGAAVLFIKPPAFAVNTGHNSMEVSLVAADPDPVTPPPPAPVQPQELVDPNPPKPDDMVVPAAPPVPPTPMQPVEQPKVEPPPPVPVPPKPHRTPTVAKGDGSAPKPGKDAITASSAGGAIMDAKPDYLSNPPPDYPEEAQRAREGGVVVLQVIINTEGRPDTVDVKTTSGYSSLDAAAVSGVRKWRFRPAELGSIKVKSRVLIPVRFDPNAN